MGNPQPAMYPQADGTSQYRFPRFVTNLSKLFERDHMVPSGSGDSISWWDDLRGWQLLDGGGGAEPVSAPGCLQRPARSATDHCLVFTSCRGRESNFGSSLYSLVHSKPESNQHLKSRRSSSEKTVILDRIEKADGKRWIDDTTVESKFVWWYVIKILGYRIRPDAKLNGRFFCRGKGLWRDIGYDAAYVQLWAATIFWVATL